MYHNDDDEDRLTALLHWLDQQGYDVDHLSYPTLRERAQAAVIPAHQGKAYVWKFYRQDTPAIAAALKLKKRASTPAAERPRRQSAAA